MSYDELIARSLQGRISRRDEARLRKWRQADPEHERRFQDFAALWRATFNYGGGPSTSPPKLEAITSEAARRRDGGATPDSRKFWQAAAVAAAFVAGIALSHLGQAPEVGEASIGEVVTGVGETVTTRLADGTVVRLAPESRLILFAPGATREVALDGRAFFAVANDHDKPFLVRESSGEARVRVVGTRFQLDARDGTLQLVVVEGRVALGSDGREVDVRSHQLAHLSDGEETLTVDVDDLWPLLAWMGRFLAFESTPLREVRSELYRRFNVTLEFDDPALAEETVTVWFGDEPIEEVVSVLCRLLESQCVMDNSIVHMARTR